MPDTDLQIKFGADVSGLQSSVAAAKGALDGLTAGLGELKTAFSNLSTVVGQQAAAMTQFANATKAAATQAQTSQGAFSGVFGFISRASEITTFAANAGALANSFNTLSTKAKALGIELGLLPALEKTATAGMVGLDVAADANPIGAVVLAIEAAVVAIVAIGPVIAGVIDWFKQLYETNATVKQAVDGLGVVFQGVGEIMHGVWDVLVLIVEVMAHVNAAFLQLIGVALKPYVDQLKESWDAWKAIIELAWTALTHVVEAIGAFINRHFGSSIGEVTTAWDGVHRAISDIVTIVTGGLKSAFDWLSSKLGDLVGVAGRFIQLNFPDIARQWSKTLNDMAGAFRDTAEAASHLWEVLTGHKAAPAKAAPAPRTSNPPVAATSGSGNGGGTAQHTGSGGPSSKENCAERASACANASVGAAVGAQRQVAAVNQNALVETAAVAVQQVGVQKAAYDQDVKNYHEATVQKTQEIAGFGKAIHTESENIKHSATDAAKAFAQAWNGIVNPMVSKFTSGLLQMAQGTKSFAQVMRGIGQQLLNDFISKVINPMIERWLSKEFEQTVATSLGIKLRTGAEAAGAAKSTALSGAGALKQITNSAVKAAGEAYSALAGIPIIGPVLGAGAAVVAFAAVEAFGAKVASAAGGFDIPAGLNPMTQLHAQEMVLPARLANPLRAMLANHAANENAPKAANDAGRDVHAHFHIHGAMDGPSFRTFLRTHSNHLSTVLQEMGRKGMRTG